MASLADVARAAGVSVTTASFVLNGHAAEMRISPQTADRVLEAVRELGYVPNVAAKKLTNAADRLAAVPDVAFMWSPNLHPSLMGSFITNAQSFFERGQVPRMNIIIAPFSPGHYQDIGRNFLDRHYNGAVFSPIFDTEIEFVDSLALRIPLVVLHTRTDRYPNVVVDNPAAGRIVARAFAANGHGSAAIFFRTQLGETTLEDGRVTGFRAACEELGMTFSAEPFPAEALTSIAARSRFGREKALEMLSAGRLPEAIFIQEDATAVSFLVALLQNGVRVPEDIEIITYGSDGLASAVLPSITTVNYPAAGITFESLRLLSRHLSDPYAAPARVEVPTDITFRDSCPRPKGWEE